MKRATTTLIFPLLYLAACSGGDGEYGDPGGNNNNPPPPAGFTITTANGLQVSQVAYQSAISTGDLAGLAGGASPTGSSSGGIAKPDTGQYLKATLAGVPQEVIVGPTIVDCAAGGSVTVTMDLVDPTALILAGTLTAGDTILNEYTMCDEGFGEIIDGDVDAVVDAFNGSILTNAYDMTMTMDLIDFQITAGADVVTANGDGTVTLNSLTALYVEASISGNSMTTDTNTSTETLTSFLSAQTVDAGMIPAPYTLLASGTLDSSQLTGAINYSTPVMFEGEDANYPHTGEFLIVGDGSSALLIAQANATDVLIEIYSNETGTGTPDDTIMTTWAELAGM